MLMFHMSNKQNVAIRTAGQIGTKKVWLSKRDRIWGLDMVEVKEDGTLVYPRDCIPSFLPIPKMDDIAEFLWEINCYLRPDLFGEFEPLQEEIQEGDAEKYSLDGQEVTRGQQLMRGGEWLSGHLTKNYQVYLGQMMFDKRKAQMFGKDLFDLDEAGYEHVFVGQFPLKDTVIEDGPGDGRIYHLFEGHRGTSFQPALPIKAHDWGEKDQLLLQYELAARFADGICRRLHMWAEETRRAQEAEEEGSQSSESSSLSVSGQEQRPAKGRGERPAMSREDKKRQELGERMRIILEMRGDTKVERKFKSELLKKATKELDDLDRSG